MGFVHKDSARKVAAAVDSDHTDSVRKDYCHKDCYRMDSAVHLVVVADYSEAEKEEELTYKGSRMRG